MKKFGIIILASLLFPFMLASCDKMDCNDGLDGQWQMYEWKSPEGDVIAGKEMKLYYSFQLQMAMFQKQSVSMAYMLTSFVNNGTSIRIYDPVKYAGNGHDDILPMDTLRHYGVPFDGVMQVERLTSDILVLSSSEYGRLSFRKY